MSHYAKLLTKYLWCKVLSFSLPHRSQLFSWYKLKEKDFEKGLKHMIPYFAKLGYVYPDTSVHKTIMLY